MLPIGKRKGEKLYKVRYIDAHLSFCFYKTMDGYSRTNRAKIFRKKAWNYGHNLRPCHRIILLESKTIWLLFTWRAIANWMILARFLSFLELTRLTEVGFRKNTQNYFFKPHPKSFVGSKRYSRNTSTIKVPIKKNSHGKHLILYFLKVIGENGPRY